MGGVVASAAALLLASWRLPRTLGNIGDTAKEAHNGDDGDGDHRYEPGADVAVEPAQVGSTGSGGSEG